MPPGTLGGMETSTVLAAALSLLLGALLAWLALRGQTTAKGAEAREQLAAVRAERDVLRERVVDLEAQLGEDAETAAALAPLQSALQRVERQVGVLERDRTDQFAAVREVLGRVEESTSQVGREAASLASSLRVSSVRGQWGEVQLRRVLEVSGLLDRCDFEEQARGTSADGAGTRPDVVVHLPGGKHLVVDAKAPMARWLDAQAEDCEPQVAHDLLAQHAKDLAGHVATLAGKQYWTAFDPSPEMVVCFVPTDATLAAALARNPGLHERALASKVVLASPGTLLALLRTVAFTWQQEALGRDAQELLAVGNDLYHRLATLGTHTSRLGRSLQTSVEAYNRFVGTLESRVLVSARRMRDLGVRGDELDGQRGLEVLPRPLTALELIETATADDERPQLDLPLDADAVEVRRAAGD